MANRDFLAGLAGTKGAGWQELGGRAWSRMTSGNPAESKRWTYPFVLFAVIEVLIAMVVSGNVFLASIMLQAVLFCLLAQGLNLVAGYGGWLAFGNIMFFGIAAYIVGIGVTYHYYDAAVGLLIAMVACAALAFGLSHVLGRMRDWFFALATFAVAAILELVFLAWGFVGTSNGLTEPLATSWSLGGLGIPSNYDALIIGLVLVFLFTAITQFIARSRWGKSLVALRDDKVAADASGIRGLRNLSAIWALSAVMTAIAGVFYMQYNFFIDPPGAFGLTASTSLIAPVIIGGLGTVWGPVIGSIVVIVGAEVQRLAGPSAPQGINTLIFGVFLLLVVRLLPGGVVGASRRGLDAYLARRRASAGRTRSKPAGSITAQAPSASSAAHDAVAAEAAIAATTSGTADLAARSRALGEWLTSASRSAGHSSADGNGRTILEIDSVRRSFGGVKALDGVSFTVSRGEVLGIMGPNGAGKTSLLNCITGVDQCDSGSVTINGKRIEALAAAEVRRSGITRTFQTPRWFAGLDVRDNVALGIAWDTGLARARVAADAAIDAMGLAEFRFARPLDLTVVNRRKLEFARAIVGPSWVLVIDELFAGLGAREVSEMIELLRSVSQATGMAVLMVEHAALEHALEIFDRLVVLDAGRVIADGPPRAVLESDRVNEAYFGGMQKESEEMQP